MKDAITNKKTIKTARIDAALKRTNRSWNMEMSSSLTWKRRPHTSDACSTLQLHAHKGCR
jgi:hypothetical protein